jgi:class 3 adenylate cyclase/tetratricopeptide (TPR) repeat protein
MKCRQCQHENPLGQNFCGECGARLAVTCGSCGASSPPSQKFCGECGAGLVSEALAKFASPESYTPKHLAEKILTSKTALEGERKQVTVLFADLKGSMELLADRDPEEARKLLDPVLEHMMEAVHRYEGTVNQVMGDGIMALFGAPLAHEDHAVRACYAALRMQEAVARYAEGVFRSHGVPIQIRVGLNSGEVVVRAIGSDLHMDYTAVGQTTHLAARMEQMATPGTILVAPATLQLAEGYVQVAARGPVAVKGLPDPVEVFELTGASAQRTRLHAAAARGLTRFVGRDAELEQLRRALTRAHDGHGQLVAVVGEPGVGKSRLVYEVTHSHRTQNWLILEAGSVSYGKATSYLPVIDLLKAYFKVQDRETHREIREKVTGKLLTMDRSLEPILPALLALLDVPVEDAQWQALDPPQRRQRTLDAVKHLLLRESQGQPLLVVFEDLHWIDAETQALLDGLVESLPTARVLLLVNYRPEYQHGWGRKTYYSQIRLDALPPESAGELLSALLGDDPALEPFKRLLVRRGNPFFIEESIRTLVETQALTGERGAYRLTRPIQAIEVPATVQVILAARIDRLPAEDKQLLQTASVIGKDVPFVLLHAVMEAAQDAVQQGLAHLQAAEFLYETRLFPDPEYTFKHALTHEVTYGSLLQERRKALHVRIVSAIERSYADRLTEHVEGLAHHAVRGAMWERAVRYLRQAGEKAVARSANREAIALFEQALAALQQLAESPETLSEALDIRIALGPCLGTIHGHGSPEKEASYVAARELCLRLDDRPRLFPALWGLWHVSFNRGFYREARDLGDELLSLARQLGNPVFLLEAHHSLWTTLYGSGDLETAELHLQEGFTQYDPERHRADASIYGGHDTRVCCLNYAALTAWTRGYSDRAVRHSQEAVQLAGQLSHPTSAAIALYYAAVVHHWRREHSDAVAKADAALDTARAHGLRTARNALLARLGREDTLDESELARLHQTVRPPWWQWNDSFGFCLLAEAYARTGLPERGLAVMAEIPEQALETVYGPEVQRCRGALLLSQGDAHASEAETCFRSAVELARRGGHRSLELRAATSLSRLLAQHGRLDEALRILGNVYGWFTEGFDTADLKIARELLDFLERSGAEGQTDLGDTTTTPAS